MPGIRFLASRTKLHPLTILLFMLTNLSKSTLFQALLHASVAMDRKLVVEWVPACDLEDPSAKEVSFIMGTKLFLFPDGAFVDASEMRCVV